MLLTMQKNTRKRNIDHSKTINLQTKPTSKDSGFTFPKVCILIALGLVAGILNSYHQYVMFENDRHFSHLSALEREMTFRTEMGLYFSYYKSIVESSSFLNGINELLRNNLTEYPNTINTLQKFNLYPEVVLGAFYRMFMKISSYFGYTVIECWLVERGDYLEPVSSCEGLGDIYYFYVTGVFVWNSLVGFILFMYGYILSDNKVFGGVLTVLGFFFNHGESTRVQWTPPLRESFGYPFCLSGMFFLTVILKYSSSSKILYLMLLLSATGFMVTWQFAQFALLSQVCCVYALFILNVITSNTFKSILQTKIIALLLSFILLFGNKLLLTSFLTWFLIVSLFVTIAIERISLSAFTGKVFHLISVFLGTVLAKNMFSSLLQINDDVHIWNLLKSKFTSFKDFHTLLYTCAIEFDFLEFETVIKLTKTFLLPCAILSVSLIILKTISRFWKLNTNEAVCPDVLYNVFQIVVFSIMTILFMRLKLFLTPHLCIITSLLISKKYNSFVSVRIYYLASIGLIVLLMSKSGLDNLNQQRNILGEYNNPELEDMLLWVNKSTPKDSVFAGPMPTMANLMLSTRRPIVNHPFYEDSEMRDRNLKVYTLYSRKRALDVQSILIDLGVHYAVIAKPWCYGYSKPGCRMTELWDVQDPQNKFRESLCNKLMNNPEPFKQVFKNNEYVILKVQNKPKKLP